MSSFSVVQEFRARLIKTADQPLRIHAPLAITLGGIACFLALVLVGPLVSRGVADDAGVTAFLLNEGAKRFSGGRSGFASAAEPVTFGWGARDASSGNVSAAAPQRRVAHARVRKLAPKPVQTVVVEARWRAVPLVKSVANLSPLDDHTLRRGDAVMTSKGIRVFRGAQRYPFAVADFRPLAFAGRIEHRSALLAIDRAIRAPAWTASFTAMSPTTVERLPVPGPSAVRVVEIARRS